MNNITATKLVFGCMLCKRGLTHVHAETPAPVNKTRALATIKAIHSIFFNNTRTRFYSLNHSPVKTT